MIRRHHLAALIAVLSAGAAMAKDQPPPHLFGPAPSWEEFRRIAEAGIANRLIDPESTRIRWDGIYMKGFFKPYFAPRAEGYIACGEVNGKNRMGGYAGARPFVVVIDYGRIVYSDIDPDVPGFIPRLCRNARMVNELLPVPPTVRDMSSPTAPAGSPSASEATSAPNASGLSLRAMPDGAYVSGVAPGSPAALAGLKPGMVIAAVNGIPLAGMGEAMGKVIDAAGNSASLTLVGGIAVKLGAAK